MSMKMKVDLLPEHFFRIFRILQLLLLMEISHCAREKSPMSVGRVWVAS